MTAALTLWTGRQRLQLDFGAASLAAGAAAHALAVPLTTHAAWLDPDDPSSAGTVLVEAVAWLDNSHRFVGAFGTRALSLRGFRVTDSLVLALSDEQLVALDLLRGGGDVTLRLDVTATVLTGEAGHIVPSNGQVGYRVAAANWNRLLDAAGSQVGVTVRVPSPLTHAHVREGTAEAEDSASTARLATRFRQAREYLREGRYEECVANCRRILEALARADDAEPSAPPGPRPRDRDLPQRWTAVRAAAAALASAAHHDDEVTVGMTWTRNDAESLLAITAALITRDRR